MYFLLNLRLKTNVYTDEIWCITCQAVISDQLFHLFLNYLFDSQAIKEILRQRNL